MSSYLAFCRSIDDLLSLCPRQEEWGKKQAEALILPTWYSGSPLLRLLVQWYSEPRWGRNQSLGSLFWVSFPTICVCLLQIAVVWIECKNLGISWVGREMQVDWFISFPKRKRETYFIYEEQTFPSSWLGTLRSWKAGVKVGRACSLGRLQLSGSLQPVLCIEDLQWGGAAERARLTQIIGAGAKVLARSPGDMLSLEAAANTAGVSCPQCPSSPCSPLN